MSSKKIIPYFNIYASDFKVFKDILTAQEIVEVLDELSNICIFGNSDFKTDNERQMMFFQKLKDCLLKSIPKYKASVKNGQKGGRPKNSPQKPTGFQQVNPQETHSETIEYNIIEYNKIKNNRIENKLTPESNETNKIISLYEKHLGKSYRLSFHEKIEICHINNQEQYTLEDWELIFKNASKGWNIKNKKVKPPLKNILENYSQFLNDDYNLDNGEQEPEDKFAGLNFE